LQRKLLRNAPKVLDAIPKRWQMPVMQNLRKSKKKKKKKNFWNKDK
jgi:hypothetical protein